jgi:hypothetical protein
MRERLRSGFVDGAGVAITSSSSSKKQLHVIVVSCSKGRALLYGNRENKFYAKQHGSVRPMKADAIVSRLTLANK